MKQRQILDKYPQMFTNSALARTIQVLPVPIQFPKKGPGPGGLPHPHIKSICTTFQSDHVHDGQNVFNEDSQPQPRNDLYASIKPLIILGRIVLIIPCSRKDSKSYKRPSLSWKVVPYFATIFLLCYCCCFQMIFDVQHLVNGRDKDMLGVMNYISNLHFLFETIMAAITYQHFLLNSDKFYLIFEKWAEFSLETELIKDFWLSPMAYGLATVATFTSLSSQGLLLKDVMKNISGTENRTAPFAEIFYEQMYPGLHGILPYHPALITFLIACKMFQIMTITYVSLLLIIFSRVMSFQFRKLLEDATGLEAGETHFAELTDKGGEFWRNIVNRYRLLCLLLKTINSFLSPFTFCWIVWNIYVISMQLYRAMVVSESMGVQKQTFTIDIMARGFRFLVSIIIAAKVNTYAKKVLELFRNCPQEYYHDTEVGRLEHQVGTGQGIGFTGMGCFGLTKPFLLQVFSAIFTMEIILLQSTKFDPS